MQNAAHFRAGFINHQSPDQWQRPRGRILTASADDTEAVITPLPASAVTVALGK
jgi:hypothetical protein